MGFLSFSAPLLLLGLLAAGVPIVLHLLSTVQAPQVNFPTLRFLQRSMQKTARRRHVQNLLLLLLRTALIVAVVLAVAKPALKLAGLTPSSADQAVVVILDNSLSMQTRAESVRRLEIARQAVRDLVTGPNRPAHVALLATNGSTAVSPPLWLSDVKTITERLNSVQPACEYDDLSSALQNAAQLLEKAPLPTRSIWVFSDLQRVSTDRLSQAGELAKPELAAVPVFIMDCARGRARNVGVTDLYLQTPASVVGARARILATVANSSDSPQRVTVGLEVNGLRLLDQPVQLGGPGAADAIRTVSFDYRFTQAGPLSGRVLLEGHHDDLPADDSRWFAADVKDKLNVLVLSSSSVAGAKLPASHPAFFVMAALKTSPSLAPRLEAAETFAPNRLSDVNVLVLADVGPLPAAAQDRIDEWVRGGGVLVVFAGPRSDLNNWSQWAERKGCSLAGRPVEISVAREGEPQPVWQADLQSPLLKGLFEREQSYTGVLAYRFLEVQPLPGAVGVLKLRSGNPLVQDRPVGRGRCVQINTSPNTAWTNLPTQGMFVALLHRSAASAGHGEEASASGLTGGQAVELPAKPGETVEVVSPGTGETAGTVSRLECAAGAQGVRFGQTWSAGVYRWSLVGQTGGGMFVVNPDRRESDLTAWELAQVKQSLPGRAVVVASDLPGLRRQIDDLAGGTGLWDMLLFAALLFALFEVFLANRHRPAEGQKTPQIA